MSDNQDFYDPEYKDETFTRNGKTKVFRVRELSGEEAESIFDIKGKDGNTDPVKSKGLDARLVTAAVSEQNDEGGFTPIKLDKAKSMPAKLRNQLVAAVLAVNMVTKTDAEDKEQD